MTNDKVPQKPLVSQIADGIRESPVLKGLKTVHDFDLAKFERDWATSVNNPFPQKLPEVNLDPDYFTREARLLGEKERKEAEREKREEEHRQAVIKSLQNIEKNTGDFTKDMLLFLQSTKENQEEIINLLLEIVEIRSSSSQQEADSKFKKVMSHITTVTDSVSAIQTLQGMANSAYKAFQHFNL